MQFENDPAISLLSALKSFVATLRVVALRIFAITRIVGEFAGTRRRFCCATASVCVTLNFIFIFLPQHPERKASTAVVHFRDAPSIRTKITRSTGGKPQPFRRTGIYNKCDAFLISTSRISPLWRNEEAFFPPFPEVSFAFLPCKCIPHASFFKDVLRCSSEHERVIFSLQIPVANIALEC